MNTPPALRSTPEIITSTPIQLSQCPEGNADSVPDFSQAASMEFPKFEESILNFLNGGGTTQAVIKALEWTDQQDLSPDWNYDSFITSKEEFNKTHLFTQDLTKDGIPELIISRVNLYVFGCKENKYITLLAIDNEGWINHAASPWIIKIEDLNSNGMPEIVVKSYFLKTWTVFRIFEWNIHEFNSLLIPLKNSIYSDLANDGFTLQMGEAILENTNNDRTIEILLRGYDPFPIGFPNRGEQYTYKWDGKNYVFSAKDFSPPVYRFEAVQDGDRYSLERYYDKALERYQDAILNDGLEWWSDERSQYEENCKGIKTNCPMFPNTPVPDEAEYSNLAAYSYFRIMVIHIISGEPIEAEFTFNKLQTEFPRGNAGSAYAEMAKEFWNEYQVSKSIIESCNRAIEYAIIHSTEVLSRLGNGEYSSVYFGEQSLVYTPQSICPF